ncbi:MAG TPA: SGNH/GDSL hydrolase family protein [Steroidobacteraceae bacterium]|nr:SGNH/GDSL hydrolase family protein [Steroidobacteraceae bacterium]
MSSRIRVTTMVAFAMAVVGATAPLVAADGPPDPQLAAAEQELARLRTDWAQLLHYRDENLRLPPPTRAVPRVIFLGDSTTESWHLADLGLTRLEVLNRGISGQTTPQMLVRFQQDVVRLRPAVVHILAATNDFAENTGPTTLTAIEDNFRSMVEIAQANHIRVVLASVLPTTDFPWRRGLQPAPKITALNSWLREYARQRKAVYVDYYSALADPAGELKPTLSQDGVYPNSAGYAVMEPLARHSVMQALGRH